MGINHNLTSHGATLGEEDEEVPAMHHNRGVPSSSLHLVHLFNDISDGSKIGAHPIRCPIGDVELGHLLYMGVLYINIEQSVM